MTWNIWGKLNLEPKYSIGGKTARQRVIEIISDSGADIITMTEAYGSAADIATALDYHYYTPHPDANLAIFSRYPMENFGDIEGLSSFSFIVSTVNLPNNRKVRVYNIWLTSEGRHIVEIKNKSLSDQEFNQGDQIRYNHLLQLLSHVNFKEDVVNVDRVPVIVAGDFNCVSHLDYNLKSKSRGLNHSRVLNCQTSKAMADVGFTDTYRAAHPLVIDKTLGYTWTTVGQGYTYVSGEGFVPVDSNLQPQYQDPYARIDYIYSAGKFIKPVNSKTIIHHRSNSDRSFPEFPSDHGAVLTTFQVN